MTGVRWLDRSIYAALAIAYTVAGAIFVYLI
jgi:hypothetical protein